MARIEFDEADLRPLVEIVVKAVVAELDTIYGDRLAFSEREAAKLLGISHTQLGEERRNGRIGYAIIGKSRTRYSRKHLMDFLHRDDNTRARR